MNEPYLSVIVPSYNESGRLPLTIVAMDAYLSKVSYPYEILVVNDGSSDNTSEVVRKMMADIKGLKLVDNTYNQGKGAVVKQGMLLAGGKIRLFTDADNSTSLDQIESLLPFFAQGYEVVIGSRALPGSKLSPPQGFVRRTMGRVSNLVIQVVNLWGIWDTQCGFKAFTAEAAVKVFQASRVVGWGFDIEILSLARECGYRIKEVPITWVNDAASHVGPSAYFHVFWENIKIRWWRWTGAYPI